MPPTSSVRQTDPRFPRGGGTTGKTVGVLLPLEWLRALSEAADDAGLRPSSFARTLLADMMVERGCAPPGAVTAELTENDNEDALW